MLNDFFHSQKKIPFEQYYRLHVTCPRIANCETGSNSILFLPHASFEQKDFHSLHDFQEATKAFNIVLDEFVLFFTHTRTIHTGSNILKNTEK